MDNSVSPGRGATHGIVANMDVSAQPDIPVYLRSFWAKAYPYRQRGPERIHLLAHHLADVGATMEALLRQPTIRRRVASAGGLDDLPESTAARLAVFAALHDVGKANVGFQCQIWPRDAAPLPARVGHIIDLAPVLTGLDGETVGWFYDGIGWDAITAWDDRGGEIASDMLVATLSHHGDPIALEGGRDPNPAAWRAFGAIDPSAEIPAIGRAVHEWFPAAWDPAAPPLPPAPAFQHMFLGLCTLADWIGSNTEWFAFSSDPDPAYIDRAREQAARALRDPRVGLDIEEQRAIEGAAPARDFRALFDLAEPRPVQEHAVGDLAEHLMLIEAETGSGKTEAALWRFSELYRERRVDGAYFALPTRAAAKQLHERTRRFAQRAFESDIDVALAVPGYESSTRGLAASQYADGAPGLPWATESPKRFLAAQIAVGTVDQAMLGALRVRHAHLRSSCLARNLLIVDEVHASDAYMRAILATTLRMHLDAGGYAVLLSATLGAASRSFWLGEDVPSLDEAITVPYPAVSVKGGGVKQHPASREKRVSVSATADMDDYSAVAADAVTAARNGASVLVVRNTVDSALRTQRAVEAAAGAASELLLHAAGIATPHHGRYAAADRRELDRAIEERFGKGRADSAGAIAVGTQTLEQSLDLDADLLIADICPADVLLQRIGRLHRHDRGRPAGFERPQCIVLTPGGSDLAPLLARPRNGLGAYVYPDLRMIEAVRRLIGDGAEWAIPDDSRRIVECGTHPEALSAIADDLGDPWMEHALQVDGARIAERLVAERSVIDTRQSFCGDNADVLFPSDSERIRTRLGDPAVDVTLSGATGAFGGAVDRIAIPRRWLPAVISDPGDLAAAAEPVDGGFAFTVEGRAFTYDRFGLARAPTAR